VRSVWFSFTPAATATYELSLCTNTATTVHETVMAIYTSGGGCGSVFSQLFCNHIIPCANKPRSGLTAALSNNVTYDIVAWEGTSGAYTPGETSLQLRIDRFQSPMVTTLPASSLTSTSAVLNGTVNPDGFTLTAWFEWGATTNYGHTTPSTNIPGGTSAVALSQAISGLQAGQTNHFRIVVNSTAGTPPGNDRTFAWSFAPPRFTSYLRGDQALVLRFTGQPGQVYFIDASVNFAEWLGLGVAADLGSGLFGLTNSSALAARFYRVRSP
jgi:hypothetical protein